MQEHAFGNCYIDLQWLLKRISNWARYETEDNKGWTMHIILGIYHQTSDISDTLVGNNFVNHSEVVGASPIDTAPTTSSFST